MPRHAIEVKQVGDQQVKNTRRDDEVTLVDDDSLPTEQSSSAGSVCLVQAMEGHCVTHPPAAVRAWLVIFVGSRRDGMPPAGRAGISCRVLTLLSSVVIPSDVSRRAIWWWI